MSVAYTVVMMRNGKNGNGNLEATMTNEGWNVSRGSFEEIALFLDDVERLLNLTEHPFLTANAPSREELPAWYAVRDRLRASLILARGR